MNLKSLLRSKPAKFLKGGIALKVFSFGLNYILVSLVSIQINIAYFVVLLADFLVGYFINRFFVFSETSDSHKKTFSKFLVAGLSFRALNYFLYSWLITKGENMYLAMQFITTIIILVMKLYVYKKIFK